MTEKDQFKDTLYDADGDKFKEVITKYREKCSPQEFEEMLSEFYEEAHLRGIQFTDSQKVYVENQLIRVRLFEKAPKQSRDFSQVLKRIEFLDFLITDLNRLNQSNDAVFLYICRSIAINLRILKRQLSFTYDVLPWEEIEFCLVVYISRFVPSHSALTPELLIDRETIMTHLNNFNTALSSERPKLRESKTKFTSRAGIKQTILDAYPFFEALYADYEIHRDIYCLERMQRYLSVVLSSKKGEVKKFAVERTLQIIGENLKSTPESPNISPEVEQRLLDSAPKHLKQMLSSLRNSLKRTSVLEKKILLGDKYDENIINDLKKIHLEIVTILSDKVKRLCDGKKVKPIVFEVSPDLFITKESEKLDEILAGLKRTYQEDEVIYAQFERTIHRKLIKLHKLQNEMKATSDWKFLDSRDIEEENEDALAKFITTCSSFAKLKNSPRELLQTMVDAIELHLFRSKDISTIEDYKEILESEDDDGAERKVGEICKRIEMALANEKEKNKFRKELEAQKNLHMAKTKILKGDIEGFNEMIYYFPNKTAKALESLSPKENLKQIQSTVKSVNDAYATLLQNVASDTIISLKNYRNVLSKFCSTLKLKKEEVVERLVEAFKEQIQGYFDNQMQNLIDITYNTEIRLDLQMVSIEMLLLDLLEILTHTYSFVDNTSYLDKAAPILIGKNLRNYLAHGDPLVDVLHFDPHLSMATHSVLFLEKYFEFEEGVDYGQNVNFNVETYTERYRQRLAIAENQSALFEAAQQGNMRGVRECVAKGASLRALSVNQESTLACAAKANNVELMIYFFENGVTENVATLLLRAAETGCESIIEYLMETYPETSSVLASCTLLYPAVANNNRSMVSYLLNIGCSASTNYFAFTPLHLAAEKGFDIIVQKLLDHGASVFTRDEDGDQPLHLAARAGSWLCAKMLLGKGAEIDAKNKKFRTPLHIAVRCGHVEFVENLLNSRAKPDVQDVEGCTPLFLAAMSGHEGIVKLLLKCNANVEMKTVQHLTPLHAAAIHGHESIVTVLLEGGAIISSTDQHLWTPLHFAAFGGFENIIKPLFRVGMTTDTLLSPLHLAAYGGHEKSVRVLLDLGETIDSVQESGCTALYIAAHMGREGTVDVLVKAGANTNMLNDRRVTPFLTAVAAGHLGVVKLLLKRTVSQVELNCGLHAAVEYSQVAVVEVLMSAGADPNYEVETECRSLESMILGNKELLQTLETQQAFLLPTETRNCLLTASQTGNLSLTELLIKNGANVNSNAVYYLKVRPETLLYSYGNFLQPLMTTISLLNRLNCLHFAAINGHTEVIRALLKGGAQVDEKDAGRATALFHAAIHDHKGALRELLTAGADVNVKNAKGLSALHVAAFRGCSRTVPLLIAAGADVHGVSEDGVTVLDMAALGEQTAVLEMLLEKEFSFDERYMSLQKNIIHGKAASVEVLLEDVDINFYSCALFDCYSPLHNAAYFGQTEVVRVLLRRGFPIDSFHSVDERITPLQLAVQQRHLDVIKLLLESGADIQLPLFGAIRRGDVVMVGMLLEKGADLTKRDSHNTALHVAACSGSQEMLTLILENLTSKCDDLRPHLDAPDSDGDTPLMWAVEDKKFAAAQTLIDFGADVNTTNQFGMTALHWAVDKESFELVQLLVENGVDVSALDSAGETAADVALRKSAAGGEQMEMIAGFLMSMV